MGALTLLARARAEGLTVTRDGETLVVRGPQRAEPTAKALLAAKPDVLTALAVEGTLGLDQSWREESIAECRQRLCDAAALIREYARSRWPEEADAWSDTIPAGFYVRDLLAGFEAVLGPWNGWGTMRARLDHQTGPTAIARLWSAYATLPAVRRQEVRERGDRAQSPPACLWRNRRA